MSTLSSVIAGLSVHPVLRFFAIPASRSALSEIIGTGIHQRPDGALSTVFLTSICTLIALACLAVIAPHFTIFSVALAITVWLCTASLIVRHLRWHSHRKFGTANRITTARAGITAVLAGFIPAMAQLPYSSGWMWGIAIVATITLCMDGLDGYMARKSGLSSAFGARFDMETDALLGLVITLLVWQSGKTGVWVLSLGLMRYVFLAASLWLAPLRAPLFPSMRRKVVCVIQVGALCLMLCPWLSSTQVSTIGATALVSLLYSFLVDVAWLFRRHRSAPETIRANTRSWSSGLASRLEKPQ